MLTIQHFIDGRYVDPVSGEWFDKSDPATGQTVARVPDGDGRDVDAAVAAAVRAFPRWSRTPVAERARLLSAIADRIDARLEELALAECIDGGKPLKRARMAEIPRASANFRFFATAIEHFHYGPLLLFAVVAHQVHFDGSIISRTGAHDLRGNRPGLITRNRFGR